MVGAWHSCARCPTPTEASLARCHSKAAPAHLREENVARSDGQIVALEQGLRYPAVVQRVVELPSRGRLIVVTDLQGNLADLVRVEELFEQAAAGPDGAVLVVTGDLVHGPEISEQQWPPYLGSFFEGDSVAVLERAQQLQERHPGRVHYLLGNHEHAHLGGPVVAKFFPDEARRLELLLGPERSASVRRWFAQWPLVALARNSRLLMMHAAPAARIESAAELDALELEPRGGIPGQLDPILTQLLWSRSTTAARARTFLDAFDPELNVAVYGHDVAREGYAIDREALLCISTSFGCFDGDKLYLDWDLSMRADSARELADIGLRPLYPDAPPVYRASLGPLESKSSMDSSSPQPSLNDVATSDA